MGPDESAEHVTLQQTNKLKSSFILHHVPVQLLS